MNQTRIRELVDQLDRMSQDFSVGYKNQEAINQMTPLLSELDYHCAGHAYLSEKLCGARHNFGLMFSPRKHRAYGGAEEVSHRFRSDLHLVIKWIDNHMHKHDDTPEGEP